MQMGPQCIANLLYNFTFLRTQHFVYVYSGLDDSLTNYVPTPHFQQFTVFITKYYPGNGWDRTFADIPLTRSQPLPGLFLGENSYKEMKICFIL